MAAPRVFISSTFYDLKQARNNIADFISSLGYEPVMHERAGVAYTQTTPLENDCYHELSSCDIVVCIIGNHFGSKSTESDLSITMNEIQNAIKSKKKVYIFIANDVYTENRTYLLNKDSGSFKSAYTDDIKIHEFIAELNNAVKNRVIVPFDTTDQIIDTLRGQFAGLLQYLLQREASLTDEKTAYDLQESADRMRSVLEEFIEQKEEFFGKFDSTIYASNQTLFVIKSFLGMKSSSFFARDLNALDEFMSVAGFVSVDVDDPFEDARKYMRETELAIQQLVIKEALIGEKGILKDIRKRAIVEQNLKFTETKDDDLPF